MITIKFKKILKNAKLANETFYFEEWQRDYKKKALSLKLKLMKNLIEFDILFNDPNETDLKFRKDKYIDVRNREIIVLKPSALKDGEEIFV